MIELPRHGAVHKIDFKSPERVKFTARLLMNGREMKGNHFMVHYRAGHADLEMKFPATADYELELFAKEWEATGLYKPILKKKLKVSVADASGYPTVMEAYQNSSSQLIGPKRSLLRKGKKYNFKIIVPNARKVALIDGEQWHWLKSDSATYSGHFAVNSSKVIVAAAFSSQTSRFEYLLTYDIR